MRWIPIIKYYAQMGIETTVLTTKNRLSEINESLESTKVHYAGYNTLLDWLYFTFRIKKRRQVALNNSEVSRPKSGNKFFQRIIDLTWRKYYWPDGSMLFLKPGIIKAGKILGQDKSITHVISVGLPFTCHLIAAQLKEKYPNLHWHQDIEDPFSYSEEFWVNNFSKYRQNNIDAEQRAFQLSDSISVTNERAKTKYENLFNISGHKLSVIYPLFGEYDNTKILQLELDSNKIHIGYFGSFYENVRSPRPLLAFLDFIKKQRPGDFKKYHFHFFGQQNRFSMPIFDEYSGLKRNITLHGLYDRDLSISAMKQMDVLLNVGNTTDYHLPSKAVDYLYINKPLINITSIAEDATSLFLDGRVEECNLLLQENDYAELSRTMLAFTSNREVSSELSKEKISPYTTEAITEKYLKAMQVNQELL
jgi:hypothetical protein